MHILSFLEFAINPLKEPSGIVQSKQVLRNAPLFQFERIATVYRAVVSKVNHWAGLARSNGLTQQTQSESADCTSLVASWSK